MKKNENIEVIDVKSDVTVEDLSGFLPEIEDFCKKHQVKAAITATNLTLNIRLYRKAIYTEKVYIFPEVVGAVIVETASDVPCEYGRQLGRLLTGYEPVYVSGV